MTKAEILKTHKMTEKEFYEKFPTQEAYNQFQMGGSLSPKQKFQMGGIPPLTEITTPVVSNPVATTVAASPSQAAIDADNISSPVAPAGGGKFSNYFKSDAGKSDIKSAVKGLPNLSAGAQQPNAQDPNAPVKKSTGKTIGGIAGGIAGVALAPFTAGISTVVGPALGSAIGGGIDNAQYKNKTEDYNAVKSSQQNAMTSNIAGNFNPSAQGKQFKMGGNFTEYHGNTHENGGIPIGQSEVEGGETNHNGYI
jgi:hypothetical protein